jgi:hypothetical protein
MGERIGVYIPYVLAVLFPPVGLLLGVIGLQQDRETGIRLIAISVLALVVWVLLFTA